MNELLASLQPTVDRLGGVGMALIAALDTSFVSLPTVNDFLLVWQTIRHPDRWLSYSLWTTAGSVVGSMVIYYLSRWGGDALLHRRLSPGRVSGVKAAFARYGVWAMLAISFAPPPAPYKIFVLLAGAGGVGPVAFAVAVAVGRGARYLAEAWLARIYGHEAATLLQVHLADVAFGVLGVSVVGGMAWWLHARRRRGSEGAAPPPRGR